jgi:tetratricopeptide (TPR) repeat protein
LLRRHPSYLTALQHQGKLLNDVRRAKDALAVLERARQLQPQSARALSEIGRAYYWLNDNTRAVQVLDEAVSVNPYYLPAWQYLLRVLAIAHDGGIAHRAADAAKFFPESYVLAIAGADTPGKLLDVLNAFAPRLDDRNRPAALGQFRPAILAMPNLPLLRRACELFPESPKLNAELAAALESAGRDEEARRYFAQALALRKQSDLANGEFGKNPLALKWQLASHIASIARAPRDPT